MNGLSMRGGILFKKFQHIYEFGGNIRAGDYVEQDFRMPEGHIETHYCVVEVVEEDEKVFWIRVSENVSLELNSGGIYNIIREIT